MRWVPVNIIFLLFLLAGVSTMTFSQKKEYHSKPYAGLTPKDGKAYLDIMNYDDKSKFMYLIRNDEENVYVDILLSDRAAIQRTMMFGLTTWVDTLGKKKKKTGVVFPAASGSERSMGGRQPESRDRQEMMALAMQEKNSRMVLKGFSGKDSEEEINPMTSQGVRGKFERLQGEKVRVAIIIPLEKIHRGGEARQQPLSIGFETGYLDLNATGMTSGGSMRGGDGGRYGGGGHYGSGPPGGGEMNQSDEGRQQRADINELATPSKMWVKKVVLK